VRRWGANRARKSATSHSSSITSVRTWCSVSQAMARSGDAVEGGKPERSRRAGGSDKAGREELGEIGKLPAPPAYLPTRLDQDALTETMNIETGAELSLRQECSVLRSTTKSPARTTVSCVSVM